MYQAIDIFYENNKDVLFGELKPSKSVVKDVENCFDHFKTYWAKGNTTVTKSDVPKIVNKDVDENTRNQNIRVMQEFGYISSTNTPGVYAFTDSFIKLCTSSQPLGMVVLDSLYNIKGIDNLTMYLNYLLCCLREAYTHGEVILFPDSSDKFKAKVPNKATRDNYRQRVYDLYGFIGDTRRPTPHLTTDEYTPNVSYMSRTELENLGLLLKGKKKDGMDTLVLTTNGHHLLQKINDNLSHTTQIKKYMNIISSNYDGDITPIIYYGAPGTGKTRHVQKDIYDKYHEDNRVFTTFHQSYSYEDFVEGLKPVLDNMSDAATESTNPRADNGSGDVKYHMEKGVFYKACERAAILAGYDGLEDCVADTKVNRSLKFKNAIDANKTMLICIDEINRGNMASIFGDLISLIEPSKRLGAEYEMLVTLPYSKEKFGVPANLFIVGTMNTADRSIQLLDSALRRRFRFKELQPNYSLFDTDKDELKTIRQSAKTILQRINARIRSILNKDNQIGHSYLMNVTNNKDIIAAIVNKIIPLLEEYFYNEIEKVRLVLNESDNTKHPFYIEDTEAKEAYKTYLSMDNTDEEKSFYMVDDSITKISNEDECGQYLKHLLGEDE